MTDTQVRPIMPKTAAEMAAFIDHTLLKPQATAADIVRLCDEAARYQFASVCVNPVHVAHAVKHLAASRVPVCTVVGFPLGANAPGTKADEARRAIGEGALEIDMVLFAGGLKAREDGRVLDDIAGVATVCRQGGALCKVILETCLLNDEEKTRACRLSVAAGAHFVKTSTGFGSGGATVEDVALMYAEVASAGVRVKASGGVRTLEDARRMIAAGASRIGTSGGVEILMAMDGGPSA